MRAHARLRAGPGGRLERLVDDPPVAWRPTRDAVFLVGTAGGPAGDDVVQIDVEVAAGGRLAVRSSAAAVVYAGTGTTHRIRVSLEEGAAIDWAPEPVIVTSGADHLQATTIEAAGPASIDWTELLILGRHGEEPGRADLRLHCAVAGTPRLRHRLQVGAGAPGWDGPAVLGGNRAVALRLVVGPDLAPPPARCGPGWAWMELDGPGWLLTAVASDLPALRFVLSGAGCPSGAAGCRSPGDGMSGDGQGDPAAISSRSAGAGGRP